MRILVVEDKPEHQESARATLDGHELFVVESYDAGINMLSVTSFDVVLTDMMMPMSEETLEPRAFNPSQQVPYGFVIALLATLKGAKFVAMVTDTNHHKGAMSAALDHLGDSYYRESFQPNFVINGAKAMFVHTPFYHEVLGQKQCGGCKGTGTCSECKGMGQSAEGRCFGCIQQEPGKCHFCRGAGKIDEVRRDRKDWGKVLADLLAE